MELDFEKFIEKARLDSLSLGQPLVEIRSVEDRLNPRAETGSNHHSPQTQAQLSYDSRKKLNPSAAPFVPRTFVPSTSSHRPHISKPTATDALGPLATTRAGGFKSSPNLALDGSASTGGNNSTGSLGPPGYSLPARYYPSEPAKERRIDTKARIHVSVLDQIRKFRLPERLIRRYLLQALHSLNHLHSNGILHCDIKLENMLVGEGDVLELVNPALYRTHRASSRGETRRQGTLLYMSPDLIRTGEHTQASDLYSLGCCILEMVTGERPSAVDHGCNHPRLPHPSFLSRDLLEIIERLFVAVHDRAVTSKTLLDYCLDNIDPDDDNLPESPEQYHLEYAIHRQKILEDLYRNPKVQRLSELWSQARSLKILDCNPSKEHGIGDYELEDLLIALSNARLVTSKQESGGGKAVREFVATGDQFLDSAVTYLQDEVFKLISGYLLSSSESSSTSSYPTKLSQEPLLVPTKENLTQASPGTNVSVRDQIRKFRLPERHIRQYLLQALEGLNRLHSNGILHCDIKPENMRIVEGGILTLVNFALCRTHGASSSGGEVPRRGTLLYLSPEYLRTGIHDEASDLYALAGSVLEMVTGKRLWAGVISEEDCSRPEKLAQELTIRFNECGYNHPPLPDASFVSRDLLEVIARLFLASHDKSATTQFLLEYCRETIDPDDDVPESLEQYHMAR